MAKANIKVSGIVRERIEGSKWIGEYSHDKSVDEIVSAMNEFMSFISEKKIKVIPGEFWGRRYNAILITAYSEMDFNTAKDFFKQKGIIA